MEAWRARCRDSAARAAPARHGRPWRVAARALTLAAVIAATLAGGYLALVSYSQVRALSVGEIRLSVSPGHKGALDVYVPLVDWGARFESIRLPVRLRVDVRTRRPRRAAARWPTARSSTSAACAAEARDAIASYLRALILVVTLCALALGLLTAFAVRHRVGPRLRYTVAAASVTALGLAVALVVLLPPRGEIDTPQYYAYGADIPRALDAVSSVRRSGRALDQELDAQLVGLARLVTDARQPHAGRGRAADHDRVGPAQQRHLAADPRARGRRRAGVLPRRPVGPRLAARDRAGRAGGGDRQAVRVRHRQPRLRPLGAGAGRRRRRSC